jgi:hypothetical protein
MVSSWKAVRVFISSTFRDMHAERDHLVKVVFPALRERLEKYRVYLIDIDLRWGVTREQAENDRVLDLCLHEIDVCRPFFLGILSERYGWVPKRYAADALKRFGWIQQQTGKSLTELEIIHGVLRNRQMRGHAFFYFRDPNCLQAVPEAVRREVYAETDSVQQAKLADLKRRIRYSGYPVMENYPARWDPDAYDRPSKSKGRLVGLEEFCKRVQEQLWTAIQEELQLPDTPPAEMPADPLAEELDFHDRFMESRLRVYVGREQIQRKLFAFAEANEPVPCLVTGPSGSGKSASLAKFVTEYRPQNPDTLVIPHFVGASPRSTGLRDMLRRFCQELKDRFHFAEDVPEETAKLMVTFREFLGKVPAGRRLVLVIDALNQLDELDRTQELWWLPTQVPPHVRIIVSSITDSGKPEPVLEAFRQRRHVPLSLDPLGHEERQAIVQQVPSLSAKTLDADQIRLLLDNPATTNPLFLLVALEELRGFGSYEQLNARIAAFPRAGDTVTAIFTQVIERLEEEFDREVVQTVLSLLACARRGLSEREMQELVAGLAGKEDLFPVLRQLRPYLLSRAGLTDFYHRNLARAVRERYLGTEEKQRAAHARMAAYFQGQEYFLESLKEQRQRARRLPPTPRPVNVRKVDELPWQLYRACAWEKSQQLLTDLLFLAAKAEAGMIFPLLGDFDRIVEVNESFVLKQIRRALSLAAPALAARGELVFQSLYNRLHHEETESIRHLLRQCRRELQQRPFWIRAISPFPETYGRMLINIGFAGPSLVQALSATAQVLVLTGPKPGMVELRKMDTGEVLSYRNLTSVPQHGLALREDGQRLAWIDGRGLIWADHADASLEGRPGERVLAYHPTQGILAIRRDHSLVAWDPDHGTVTVLVQGLPSPLRTLRTSRDGKRVFYLAGIRDQRLGILTLTDHGRESGSLQHQGELQYDGPVILDADLSSEGESILLACQDRHVRIVNVQGAACLAELAYERCQEVVMRGAPIRCALGQGDDLGWAFLATNGACIACWNWADGRVTRLEHLPGADGGEPLVLFEPLAPSGGLFLSTATRAGVVTRKCRHTHARRHQAEVNGCVITAAKSIVSFSQHDNTVRWFNPETLSPLAESPLTRPTAISEDGTTDRVAVGSYTGSVCVQTSAGQVRVFQMFAEPVAALFLDGNKVYAASKSGEVRLLNVTSGNGELLRGQTTNQMRQRIQQKLLPAGKMGLCWSARLEEQPDGWSTVVTRIDDWGQETAFLITRDVCCDFSVDTDGELLCLAGEAVQVWNYSNKPATLLYHRSTPARNVAWLGGQNSIAVALHSTNGLELWQLAKGLPTVAEIDLPMPASCLAVRGNWMAVGFPSGELMTVCLEKGA